LAEQLDAFGLDVPEDAEGFADLAETLESLAGADAPLEADFTGSDGVLDQEAFDAAVADWEDSVAAAEAAGSDLAATEEAFAAVDAAQADVAAGQEAPSDAAVREAMVDGLNATGAGPVTDADITDGMFGWVSDRMGLGKEEGLVPDYIAREADEAGDGDEAETDAAAEEATALPASTEEAALYSRPPKT
jgi:hypothetical protein